VGFHHGGEVQPQRGPAAGQSRSPRPGDHEHLGGAAEPAEYDDDDGYDGEQYGEMADEASLHYEQERPRQPGAVSFWKRVVLRIRGGSGADDDSFREGNGEARRREGDEMAGAEFQGRYEERAPREERHGTTTTASTSDTATRTPDGGYDVVRRRHGGGRGRAGERRREVHQPGGAAGEGGEEQDWAGHQRSQENGGGWEGMDADRPRMGIAVTRTSRMALTQRTTMRRRRTQRGMSSAGGGEVQWRRRSRRGWRGRGAVLGGAARWLLRQRGREAGDEAQWAQQGEQGAAFTDSEGGADGGYRGRDEDYDDRESRDTYYVGEEVR